MHASETGAEAGTVSEHESKAARFESARGDADRLRPHHGAGAARVRRVRRPRRRWRHHGRGGGARRGVARVADRARRTPRLRVRHVVALVEVGARRIALPGAERVPARVRGLARAPDHPPERAPPRAGAAVSGPDLEDRGLAGPPAGAPARDRDVDVRPRRRLAHPAPPAHQQGRGAAAHTDVACRSARVGVSVLRLPGRRRAPDT